MDLTWQEFWYKSKILVKEELGMTNDLLHVHFGLAAFIIFAVLFRKYHYGIIMSWLVVVGIQGLNEFLDAKVWVGWTGSVNWLETAKDFIATLFWPTVLILVCKWIGPSRENG